MLSAEVLEHSRKRRRTQAQDILDPYNEWFPWPDRIVRVVLL